MVNGASPLASAHPTTSEKAWPRCSRPFMYGYGKVTRYLPPSQVPSAGASSLGASSFFGEGLRDLDLEADEARGDLVLEGDAEKQHRFANGARIGGAATGVPMGLGLSLSGYFNTTKTIQEAANRVIDLIPNYQFAVEPAPMPTPEN